MFLRSFIVGIFLFTSCCVELIDGTLEQCLLLDKFLLLLLNFLEKFVLLGVEAFDSVIKVGLLVAVELLNRN